MDEPVPSDSDPSQLPTGKHVNSVGRRTAKLTLWWPFIGLFLMLALGTLVGDQAKTGLPESIALDAISSLFFAGGLVLGITALRRTKIEGREGIMGRTVIGMVLSGLLLCVALFLMCFAIYVSGLKAKLKQQEASNEQKFEAKIKEVNAAFRSQVEELQSRYESSWAELTNPPVLVMAGVKSTNELKAREQKVGVFIAACNAFLEFSKNPSEVYQQELAEQQLSPKLQERLLGDFTKSISGKNPQIINLRQADVRRGQALLKAVTFLETTWGRWHYDSVAKTIRFKKTADEVECDRNFKEFNAATDEALRLKAQMIPK